MLILNIISIIYIWRSLSDQKEGVLAFGLLYFFVAEMWVICKHRLVRFIESVILSGMGEDKYEDCHCA